MFPGSEGNAGPGARGASGAGVDESREPGGKPGSVVGTAIPLGAQLPAPSSNLPERRMAGPAAFPIWSCSGRGMPSTPGCPGAWWALAPPFHPCLRRKRRRRSAFCGAVRGSPLPGVTRRPALWSPDFPPRNGFRGGGLPDSLDAGASRSKALRPAEKRYSAPSLGPSSASASSSASSSASNSSSGSGSRSASAASAARRRSCSSARAFWASGSSAR